MKPLQQQGVFEDKGFLWTKNRTPGHKVYGEKLRFGKGGEYRNWNPFRSKMAALIRSNPRTIWPAAKDDILYLGAASGTTVSHISDLTDGLVYAVEFSSRSARDLLYNLESRENVIPIVADAGKPLEYAPYVAESVSVIIQDVAQRHQVDIFLRNVPFLRRNGIGFFFVKARSIRVSGSTTDVYNEVRQQLIAAGLKIEMEADLDPFEKDHRAFIVRKVPA